MTDKTPIRALIESVEAGNKPIAEFGAFGDNVDSYYIHDAMNDAFNGSLDAALALHEALLPVYGWKIHMDLAQVWHSRWGFYAGRSNINPARAWLLAILKAYEAQQ